MTSIRLHNYDGEITTFNGTLQVAIQEFLSNDFYHKLISDNDNALSFIILRNIYTDRILLKTYSSEETSHKDILNNHHISGDDLLFGD